MEKGVNKQNFRFEGGRKKTVAGEDLVASIPRVRIVNRVGVDVPVAVVLVPVGVHGPELKHATRHLYHCFLIYPKHGYIKIKAWILTKLKNSGNVLLKT